jgi:hypothetical protein
MSSCSVPTRHHGQHRSADEIDRNDLGNRYDACHPGPTPPPQPATSATRSAASYALTTCPVLKPRQVRIAVGSCVLRTTVAF